MVSTSAPSPCLRGFQSALRTTVGDGGGDVSEDPFGGGGESSSGLKPMPSIRSLLQKSGISFPEGATAFLVNGNSSLVVRNTSGNLDLIEQLIENTRGESQQVRIMTKFVEVTQENTGRTQALTGSLRRSPSATTAHLPGPAARTTAPASFPMTSPSPLAA